MSGRPHSENLVEPKPVQFAAAEAAASAEPKLCSFVVEAEARQTVSLRCYLADVPPRPKSLRRVPPTLPKLDRGGTYPLRVTVNASVRVMDLGAGSVRFPGSDPSDLRSSMVGALKDR